MLKYIIILFDFSISDMTTPCISQGVMRPAVDASRVKGVVPAMVAVCSLLLFSFTHARAITGEAGEAAPGFTLRAIGGEPVSLSEFRGSIVVLVYWRTDQERSLQAITDLQGLYGKYRDRGVRIIGISAEVDAKESISAMVRDRGIEFPMLLDSEREVYGAFGIRVYPSTIIIDREGKFAHAIPGHALSYKLQIDGRLRYMLGEISEEELKEYLSPEREVKDEALLKAQRRYNLALKFTGTRLYDQAIMMARQSIMAKPDFADSHVLLGFLLLETDETDGAFETFQKALEIAPASRDARTGLGSVLIAKGELDRAIKILTEAAELNPHPQRAFYELGRAYALKGEESKSAEMYKKALSNIIHKHILPSSVSRCE